MKYFPIFLKVKGKRILVAGGGGIALAKLRVILKSEAQVEVFASKPSADVEALAGLGKLTLHKRFIEADDAHGAALIYSAYFKDELNAKVAAIAKSAGVLANVVDGPNACDFISPAIVDRDPVVVAIGTEGAAPVLARKIKADLEERLLPNLGLMARVAKNFRHAVEVLPFGRVRRDYWSDYYAQDISNENDAQIALEDALASAQTQADKIGEVAFVGAGPGDPELLTLKARKRIDKADVVIHDGLVTDEILELARREAKIISVAKKGYGPSWKQDDINDIMIKHAQKGELVVRLKGGDPSIYGRLDEEIDALDDAGIAYEVVPGITSAVAGAAKLGRSLTSRGRNSELRFITGREVEGFAEQDWRKLSQDGAVAAIYMGAKAARFIQGRLLMHGAHPDTPITAMSNVSRPNEITLPSTIGELPEALESAGLDAPIILFLGLAPKDAQGKKEELPNAAQI